MRGAVAAMALAAPLGLLAGEAHAAVVRDLLSQGFEVKSTVLIPQDVAQRGIGSDWKDDLMLVLQKGTQLAFCHGVLSLATNAGNFDDTVDCSVAAPTAPASQ